MAPPEPRGYTPGAEPEATLADVQGLGAGRYRVSVRTLVFVRHAGEVLLVRRAAGRAVWPGRYNGVGGHVEAGEGLAEAARREVAEETGLEVRSLRLAGLLHATEAGEAEGVLVAVFTAEADRRAARASAEGEPVWVAPEAVLGLPLVPDLPALWPRLWPEVPAPPFTARVAAHGGATFDDAEPSNHTTRARG